MRHGDLNNHIIQYEVTANDLGWPVIKKNLLFRGIGNASNRLFSFQLSDSAGEEDPADLKRAQKGGFGKVPNSLWGKRYWEPSASNSLS